MIVSLSPSLLQALSQRAPDTRFTPPPDTRFTPPPDTRFTQPPDTRFTPPTANRSPRICRVAVEPDLLTLTLSASRQRHRRRRRSMTAVFPGPAVGVRRQQRS